MKAMIFDMDGVLVNTEPLHYECWKAALADEGVDMSYEVYKPCIGSTVGYLMKLLKEAYGETVSDAETLRARMYAKKEEIVAGCWMYWRSASTLNAIPAERK